MVLGWGPGGQGQVDRSGEVGPLVHPVQLRRKILPAHIHIIHAFIIICLILILHFRVPALAEKVALGVEVCEPLAPRALPALILALPRGVREPVVGHDVVLGEVTSPLL